MAVFPVIGIINFDPVKQGGTFKGKQFNMKRNGVNEDLTDAVYCLQVKRQAGSSVVFEIEVKTIGNPLDGNYGFDEFIANYPVWKYVYDLKITLNTGVVRFPFEGILPIITTISKCQ